jgi:putative oxidoreductase
MIAWIFRTIDSCGPTVLRLFLAGVMFPHGAQKMLGWWGGAGWKGTLKAFTDGMHIAAPLAMAAIITEFVGPICLALGLLTRVWAVGMATLMVVAVMKVHYSYGFFMNWYGKQKGEGYEYHLLVFGISLALLIMGAGNLSIDKLISGGGGGSSKPKKQPKSDKVRLK